jgi:hypothetical protein
MRHFLPFLCLAALTLLAAPVFAQTQAKRLILKDGSYQLSSKYEVHGDRVRYLSAERGEWEEVPKSMVDWEATEKYEQERIHGAPSQESIQLDKEFEAEQKAEEAHSPEVAPGLNLPPDGGIFLLDTYQDHPQLNELQQSGGELNRNMKKNILRSAVNPLASAHQAIELPGSHAKVQSHTGVPSLYVNIDVDADAATSQPLLAPAQRFKIIRVESKGSKRMAGGVKVAVTGKVAADEHFVPATVTSMTGGWAKITPVEPLTTGEYAIAEMLGDQGMNIYVWDFGVNPSAPANQFAWKPDPKAAQTPSPNQAIELKKREKQN